MSELKPYSIGKVAANKKLGSDTIEVTPIEQLPMISGEITDSVSDYTTKSQDASGGAYTENIANTVTISAKWLPSNNTNRKTAPDVRRGETVQILQFADADKYYWMPLHDWTELRRLETVIYAFSANPSETEPNNNENMYYFEVSTHKGIIHVHTSTANKEFTEFDIQLNAADGFIQVQDGIGNKFYLDAKNNSMNYTNVDGSYIDVTKKDIGINASGTITMKSKKFIGNFDSMETTAVTKKHNGPYLQQGNYTVNGALGGQMSVGSGSTLFSGDFIINGTFRANRIQGQTVTSASSLIISPY